MQAHTPMTRNVIVVSPDCTLASAWRVMQRERIRHLPVVRAGALIGMLSDRDVLVRSNIDLKGNLDVPPSALVEEAMTRSPLMTCDATSSVSNIVRVMTDYKIDAIPVVRGAHLVGLVTSTDLLFLLRDKTEEKSLPFEFRIVEDMEAVG